MDKVSRGDFNTLLSMKNVKLGLGDTTKYHHVLITCLSLQKGVVNPAKLMEELLPRLEIISLEQSMRVQNFGSLDQGPHVSNFTRKLIQPF